MAAKSKTKSRSRDPMARELFSGKYKQKVVRDKTKYTRKTKHKNDGRETNPCHKNFIYRKVNSNE